MTSGNGRIELAAPQREPKGPPAELWRLRWRLVTPSGLEIVSAWTPETRYPSITETMAEFRGRIVRLDIEGEAIADRKQARFFSSAGDLVASLSYKAWGSLAGGRQVLGGIEVEDITGRAVLILRDGTSYVEDKKRVANHD